MSSVGSFFSLTDYFGETWAQTRRRGRRREKLLDDLKDRRGYSHLKEEALDRTVWRNRFGGGFGPVVRQNTGWMNGVWLCMVLKLGRFGQQIRNTWKVFKCGAGEGWRRSVGPIV